MMIVCLMVMIMISMVEMEEEQEKITCASKEKYTKRSCCQEDYGLKDAVEDVAVLPAYLAR